MDEKAMNQEALKKEEEKVLCGANSYREQFFLIPAFRFCLKRCRKVCKK